MREKYETRRQCLVATMLVVLFGALCHTVATSFDTYINPVTKTYTSEVLRAGRGLQALNDSRILSGMKSKEVDKKCTSLCEPTGGILSIAGLMSGQCDCMVWYKDDESGDETCEGDDDSLVAAATTCCGVLDNGGGVILYILIVTYSLIGLAIVCDNYFCESLEKIVTVLKLSDDVAGATFMAAGSSAPELFTSIITVLITGGSEGLGTIAGSAIFNMMIIVAVTAIFATGGGHVLKIWWYPLVRDCIVYIFSICIMVWVMADFEVQWYEALVMLICYGGYILIMKNNEYLAELARNYDLNHSRMAAPSQEMVELGQHCTDEERTQQNLEAVRNAAAAVSAFNQATDLDRNSQKKPTGVRSSTLRTRDEVGQPRREAGINPLLKPNFRATYGFENRKNRGQAEAALGVAIQVNKAKDIFLSLKSNNLEKPVEPAVGQSLFEKISIYSVKPIETTFKYTIPDCTKPEKENFFMATFCMAILWIGILSFIMVDFCTRIGCVIGIPPLLMGLIFIAAGTSVPDALSSVAVGKAGLGDMAVANVLGSNVFNIFLGLGLPWFLFTLFHGQPFQLDKSEPITLNILLLLLYCLIFLGAIHFNGWALSKSVAYALLAAHVVFVIFSILNAYAFELSF